MLVPTFVDTLVRNPLGLTARLIFFTALIVLISSLSLSLTLIQQQVDYAFLELSEKGGLIARALAESSRYGVLAGDLLRVNREVQSVLADDSVLYAAVFAREAKMLGVAYKPTASPWVQGDRSTGLPSPPAAARQVLSLAMASAAPTVTALQLEGEASRPVTLPASALSFAWSLFADDDYARVYDVMVPIHPAMSLNLSEEPQSLPLAEAGGAGRLMPGSAYGVAEIGISGVSVHREMRRLISQMLVTTLFIMLASLAMTVFVARRITAPIARLHAAALEIAGGNLHADVPALRGDELGDLAHALSTMTQSLQARDSRLQELTHDLEEKVQARTRDLQSANEKLRDLDRLKTGLVSTASHELRTPLTSIKMHVDNLYDGIEGQLSDNQRETLHRIRSNIRRLRVLLDDLLDLSRLEAGGRALQCGPIQLAELLDHVITQLADLSDLKHVRLLNAVSRGLPPIEGDQPSLTRVFTNILDNAVKFSPPYSAIDITAVRSARDAVTVSVLDRGCGIPAEDLANIFLPFFRSSSIGPEYKGSGLGLAIVAQLVAANNGSVAVRSEVGRGSEFQVTLSVTVDEACSSA